MEISGQLHASAALPSRKAPLLLLNKRLDWSLSWPGRFEEGKTSCLCQESNSDFWGMLNWIVNE
jgi:hypothetical protein